MTGLNQKIDTTSGSNRIWNVQNYFATSNKTKICKLADRHNCNSPVLISRDFTLTSDIVAVRNKIKNKILRV